MRAVKSILKKLPAIRSFIRHHNPGLKDILDLSNAISAAKPVIIDVGANTGQTIEFFLTHYPAAEIYSFEPTSSVFENLKLKFSNYENVHLFNSALGEKEGETVLFTSGFSPTNSIYKPNIELYANLDSDLSIVLSDTKEESCKTIKFDEWYNQNINNMIIDILKIDVQGAEYDVLKGGLKTIRTKVRAIIVEIQYLNFYLGSKPFYEVYKLLYENGFELYNFFDNNRNKNYQLLENNALFINKYYKDI